MRTRFGREKTKQDVCVDKVVDVDSSRRGLRTDIP